MQVTLRQFVKEFRQLVAQNVANNSMQLGKGQCKDMEEYKRKVGFNEGLEAAGSLADNMLRQLEEQDSQEDLPPMPPMPPAPGGQM
jgi:hypothetical protein